MKKGASVVVDGRAYEVLAFDDHGNVRIEDVWSMKSRWVDYYICKFIDPNANPGAILEALGALEERDPLDGEGGDIDGPAKR